MRADVAGLDYGEHLFVWTLRKIVAGRDFVCPVITREFTAACGEDADDVLMTFRAFFGVLGYSARRRICVGPPGWFGLTGDERQILSMIRAAQADDQPRLTALVCWFARTDLQHRLVVATRALAAAFAAHDLLVFVESPAVGTPTAGASLGLVS